MIHCWGGVFGRLHREIGYSFPQATPILKRNPLASKSTGIFFVARHRVWQYRLSYLGSVEGRYKLFFSFVLLFHVIIRFTSGLRPVSLTSSAPYPVTTFSSADIPYEPIAVCPPPPVVLPVLHSNPRTLARPLSGIPPDPLPFAFLTLSSVRRCSPTSSSPPSPPWARRTTTVSSSLSDALTILK